MTKYKYRIVKKDSDENFTAQYKKDGVLYWPDPWLDGGKFITISGAQKWCLDEMINDKIVAEKFKVLEEYFP